MKNFITLLVSFLLLNQLKAADIKSEDFKNNSIPAILEQLQFLKLNMPENTDSFNEWTTLVYQLETL